MKHILYSILIIILMSSNLLASEKTSKTDTVADLFMMVWYSTDLSPRVHDVTVLGTISKVIPKEKYGEHYNYEVEIKIDEIIHLTKRLKKYLDGKTIIRASDFNLRKVGEKVIVLAGGEPYGDIKFLCPCWKGSFCDFGIILHPKGHIDEHYNEILLNELRRVSKGGESEESSFMEAFAHFCPRCVANHYIFELKYKEAFPEYINKSKED